MNKRALKEFAIYARNELREQIALRAQAFGINSEGSPVLVTGADYVEINGKKYPATYKSSIQKLLKEVETKGHDNVIEEVAYTWFNRFIAIRYMEVHNYLPSKVRVLSSEIKGKVDPDILTEYQYTELPVNKEEVASLLAQGNREEAFRKLLVAQCNELNGMMGFLFEKVADYTELLLPESLLHADSLINRLVNELEEVNFQEVEVIGWLYQYYMSEKKEQVGGLKNNAVKKEDLPIVTQLFTPKWIVQYMVQNSLGKLYDEWKPENNLAKEWEYYLKSSEKLPIPDVAALEEIKVIDPACGSGHILVYAFDLLYDMYLEAGYSERDIPRLIIEKNLYGLDIDKRAVQMASFALMMKGQEKYRRFLRKANNLNLNIREFIDSEDVSEEALVYLEETVGDINWISSLQEQFVNAKQCGSLIVPNKDASFYWNCIQGIESYDLETVDLLEEAYIIELKEQVLPLLWQAYFLSLGYEVVITNPPYHNKYNPILKKFINKYYKDYKTDLYSGFIYRCSQLTVQNGFAGLMTPFTWMFISSYETLRTFIVDKYTISSLIQPEYHACYDIAHVPVCTFVIHNQMETTIGEYIRLEEFRGAELQPLKVKQAVQEKVDFRFTVNSNEFKSIPGCPIAYWISPKVIAAISKFPALGESVEAVTKGIFTGNNDYFLRLWSEVSYKDVEVGNWNKYAKGGAFRRWYGNLSYVVKWFNRGEELKNSGNSGMGAAKYFGTAHICWSRVTIGKISFRLNDEDVYFDDTSPSIIDDVDNEVLLAELNSSVFNYILSFINPTVSYQIGDIKRCPKIIDIPDFKKKMIRSIVRNNIDLSKLDWDSFETSWDFGMHPFINSAIKSKKLEQSYDKWEHFANENFIRLQQNEEKLNRIFIELYGVQGEVEPEVLDKEVNIRRADRVRDTKSFLSYCIGLMMGRYSLDAEGLAYAGGEWDASKYKTFQPDSDGILPLTDTEYFEDDVVTRLQELLIIIFGQDTLAENLRWLAESLTMKNNETPVERLRRYFFDEFYSDHCKIYQKRPIYWMADSGKKKGFRALFYLHRYTPETLATMRFSYVQNLQEKLGQEQKRLDQDLVNPDLTAVMKKRYNKQLTTIKAQQDELIDFDKKMAELANQRIALDLDDGVVVNYKKIESVLAKIK
ncbi:MULTISPECIES: BREX-1 system adenine-specific DNA-methyltransferase PglX [Bacillus cereus group]|uniref:BREX-1 system adenine-specific DNA-methyltransferase PglX n=1 Tax=Bacillus cereus group TaxID=86661 RepID=UPI000BFD9B41|nr:MULTISPECIES: BREX-1 system adenine-specific DNA-methyltransferase PglX [Bacillus cereus group]MBJ8084627.1 BREX-1 system adenine-specific DNA-methyltransferase PglX [Bacillus cereus group sp. N14]PGR68856.1 SAM-dependent methyltransferase [Bacillus cereus]